jgi:hypothetical protein
MIRKTIINIEMLSHFRGNCCSELNGDSVLAGTVAYMSVFNYMRPFPNGFPVIVRLKGSWKRTIYETVHKT